MARYIDVDKALLELQKFSIDTSSLFGLGCSNCLTAVEDVLTDLIIADVVEVMRGIWLKPVIGKLGALCSVCDTQHDNKTNFCPNCGADMRERNDKNDTER